MNKASRNSRLPELREFIKENDQRLYDFCAYMLHGALDVEEMILSVFRDFGDEYRKLSLRRDLAWESTEIRVRLFHTAWRRIRTAIARIEFQLNIGRDTRELKGLDEDLLKQWEEEGTKASLNEMVLLERLSRIDPDFRAPVVLRDVLKFSDEETVRILGIRWGVYRHRLHRGRLELKDSLRGRPITSEAKGLRPTALYPALNPQS